MGIMLLARRGKRMATPRPASLLFGLGKSQMAKLNAAGIVTCGDITALPEGQQRTLLGSDAFRLVNLASGIDPRAVVPHSRAKSISSETTFAENLSDYEALAAIAETLSSRVSRQLKQQGRAAIKVTLKLKFPTHRLITRSRSLSTATQMQHDILPPL